MHEGHIEHCPVSAAFSRMIFINNVQISFLPPRQHSFAQLIREIIAVYYEAHVTHANILYGKCVDLFGVKECGTYNYIFSLEG